MNSKSYELTSDSWAGTVFDSFTYSGDTTGGITGSTYTYFQDNTDNLLGKVLTIVDASYADSAQREAVKSLMKDVFYRYRSPQNWTYTSGSTNNTGGTVRVDPATPSAK